MKHRVRRRAARSLPMVVSGAVALTLLAPTAAWGSFPGDNGPILFEKSGSAGASIYRINPDGSKLVRITGHATGESGPSVRPRGTKVAYDRAAPGSSIFSMLLSGKDQTRLSHDGQGFQPSYFGTGGGQIAYTSFGKHSGSDISRMLSDGRHKHRITSGQANDGDPDVSPNGR